VGPHNDPADVRNRSSLSAVLQAIAAHKAPFVSRADESGTHQRELALWQAAAIEPGASWYREVGQSMAGTLRVSSELQGYTMTDRGTWLKLQSGLELAIVYEPVPPELNHYAIISVNPNRHPHVNATGAAQLIDWLLSNAGQQAIVDYRLRGISAYLPLHIPLPTPSRPAVTAD